MTALADVHFGRLPVIDVDDEGTMDIRWWVEVLVGDPRLLAALYVPT